MKGKGSYSGSKSVTFQIVRASVANAIVATVSNRTYTGSAIKPAPTVTLGGKTLKRGTDYTLSYANNTKVGTATITVTGKGNYKGSKKVTFKIVNPTMRVSYRTHVQTYGWQDWKCNGTASGTFGESKRLEAIYIKLANTPVPGGISYRTHVQTYGWQDWKSNGAMSGTSGESKRLEAIEIKLTGEMANKYDVWYRVHAQRLGWMGWAKNGASAGTAGYSYRLEAIQIVLRAKGGSAPGTTYKDATQATADAFRDANATASLYDVYLPVLMDVQSGTGVFSVSNYGSSSVWSGRLEWDPFYTLYDFGADGTPEMIVHTGKFDSTRRLDVFTSIGGRLTYIGRLGATRLGGVLGNDAGEFFTYHAGGGGYAIYRHVCNGNVLQSEQGASLTFAEERAGGDRCLMFYRDAKGARSLRTSRIDDYTLLANVSNGGSCYA